MPLLTTKKGFLSRCLMAVTVCAIAFSPHMADAAQKHKKKKKSHRQALSVAPIPQKNPKYASIVIDAETGTILSSDSADAVRHPASLTKMMTLLMVFEALDSGKLRPGQMIRVSQRAAAMPASKLGLRAGSSIRLEDAMASLATLSANDMSVALAETLGGGSESNFARMMTDKAKAIGMSRTRYYNASGLPNQYQVTTARDQARLARYILANHPNDSRIFAKQRFSYGGRTYNNHNRLMETYAGMDCCKTGFINASGFNLVASARRDGRRLIGVVFGGRTTVSRNTEMASLLDAGFSKSRNIDYAALKKPQAAPAPKLAAQQPQAAPQTRTPNPYAVASNTTTAATITDVIEQAAMQPAAPPVQIKKLPSKPVHARAAQTIVPSIAPSVAPEAGTPASYEPNPSQTLGTLNMGETSREVVGMGDQYEPPIQTASLSPTMETAGWSVQIGAYQTRLATDQAIDRAFKKLPAHLRKNTSTVVPLRTADAAWMFRARLTGFTQREASEACKYFKDCLTISPQAY